MNEQLARQIADALSASTAFGNVRVENASATKGLFVVKMDYPGFSFGGSDAPKGTITILSAVDDRLISNGG